MAFGARGRAGTNFTSIGNGERLQRGAHFGQFGQRRETIARQRGGEYLLNLRAECPGTLAQGLAVALPRTQVRQQHTLHRFVPCIRGGAWPDDGAQFDGPAGIWQIAHSGAQARQHLRRARQALFH